MIPEASGLGNPSLNYVDSLQEAERFLRWVGERRPLGAVSIDLETGELPGFDTRDALSPWHGKIRLAQVGDSETGWAIPWDEWSGVFYQAMNDYRGPIICHNIAFEAKWLTTQSRYKFPWHLAHDTMLMSQVINPAAPTHALKPLTTRLIDPRAAYMQQTLDESFTKNGWTWGTIPTNYQPYWQYGALDTIITTRLFLEHFYPQVQPGTALSIPYELEMNVRRIATTMEINGARVDLEYSEKQFNRLLNYVEEMKIWAHVTYGVSITSPVQLARLFESMGAEITKRTPSGNPSVDKDQLALFQRDGATEVSQLAEAVLNQRKAEKLASSYFENFLTKNVNGVLHPDIRIMAARTGRMSITEPALQTLPSNDPLVRDAFLPRNEGEVIVSSDLDQVEFRLTANFSEDPALIELFLEADRTGGDVFTSIMRQIYQDDSLVKEDPRRKLVKSTVYGKLYGAGVEKMALTAGVPTNVMREVVESFDHNYPGVKAFQKRVENEGLERLHNEGVGYVTTETGRRLPCDEDRVYSLTNYKIQGTAAEIFKQNLVKLDQADMTEFLVVPVHDEILLSVPREDAEDAKRIVQECMTTTEGWAVPLTSGAEGPFERWGEKYHKK